MRWALLVIALAACGRLDFAEHPQVDANPDTPVLGAFSTPIPVLELNIANQQDDDPTLTADMLEVYFDSSRDAGTGNGNGDIWVAKRASVGDPFATPALVAELASPADDTAPDITGDGLTMYFGSDRAAANDRDLYVTTRPDRASPWTTPVRIAELASPGDDSGAIETADRLGLVFASNRAGSMDLYFTSRTAVGQPWAVPTPLLGDPTAEEDQHWVNGDATVVYFSASLPGSEALDIWMATRPSPSDPFGPPQRVSELDSTVDDVDPWLSPDQRTIYFMSLRTGNGDIYMATR